MSLSKTPLKIDEVAPRFAQYLSEAGTSLGNPTLQATWQAFVTFCHEPIECDDERLFFEAGLSPAKSDQPDSFYVHFSRTCYGREPIGHVWSHEVICDFLFALDPALKEFNCTVEEEDLVDGDPESIQAREQFFGEVKGEETLWQTLLQHQPTTAEIYIGES